MILDPDYARIFTQARVIAWNYGYTCAVIGSYTRDLDLLLVPWTEQATANHDQLLKLIAQSCGLRFRDGQEDILKAKPDYTDKPHGRKSCSLFFTGAYDRRWVDIGIMPCGVRAVDKPAEARRTAVDKTEFPRKDSVAPSDDSSSSPAMGADLWPLLDRLAEAQRESDRLGVGSGSMSRVLSARLAVLALMNHSAGVALPDGDRNAA